MDKDYLIAVMDSTLFVILPPHIRQKLFQVCVHGQIDEVRQLMGDPKGDHCIRDVWVDNNLNTPLHIACHYGHANIVHYLIGEHECNSYVRNKNLIAPIQIACQQGHFDIVLDIVNEQEKKTEIRSNKYQVTLTRLACENKCYTIVNYLIGSCRPKHNPGIGDIQRDHITSFIYDVACDHNHITIVQYIVEKQGFDPMIKSTQLQRTALHVAADNGSLDFIRYLINTRKCDPFVRDKCHCTLLHFACARGQISMVQFLINEQGLDPFAKDQSQQSPLEIAIINGEINVLKYCINKYGSDIVYHGFYLKFRDMDVMLHKQSHNNFVFEQVSALHIACTIDKPEIIRYLIEEIKMDPKITPQNITYCTPLSVACNHGCLNVIKHLYLIIILRRLAYAQRQIISDTKVACYSGHAPVVEFLVSSFVDPNCEDDYGNSLLHNAICGKNEEKALEVVKVLIATERCDQNKKNYLGETPLHIACQKEYRTVTRYLLEQGCYPSVANFVGKTPLWITNNADIIKQFIQYTPMEVYERIMENDIEESIGIDLIRYMMVHHNNWNPNEVTSCGDTALHLACNADKLSIVNYLLTCGIYCDHDIRNTKGELPIELTSNPDIVREFIKHTNVCPIEFLNNPNISEVQILQLIKELPVFCEDGLDILAVNSNGDTALNLACKTNRLDVVKFLLRDCRIDWDFNAKNCSEATPIQLSTNSEIIRELIRYGARPTELYSYCRKILRTSKLLETAVKVFVIGDTDVGKSTLISSLQREEWLLTRFISYVKSLILRDSTHIHTPIHHNVNTGSGVLIDDFNSKWYGHVQLYDLVGERLFHDSQSDLLKETEVSPRIFLVVIDLSKEIEEIGRSIRFWLSFLKSIQSKPKMHPIFIGNKLNTSRNDIKAKVESLLKKETPKFSNVNDYDFITLDCRDSYSSGMSELRHCLDASCITARNPKTLAFNTHCFQVYLLDKFPDDVAITIHAIQSRIEEDKKNVSATEPLFFLPYNSQRNLLKLCNELHQKSQFIFLKNPRKIKNSWVVINKTALISHTFNIFESQLETFTTNTGVLSLSTIASVEQFKIYNLEMFINFLTHLEYCREISDKETLQLMTRTHHPISLTNERWFFFPALVKHGFPEGIWKHDSSFTYYCGWILQYNSEQFFTSHFLHVMILRVMFTYAESTSSIAELPFVQQKCSVWKSGVFWANQIGAESLVDMLPDSQSIVFMMRCRDANLIECIQHRSRVINKIRRCAKEFCSLIKLKESFINPAKIIEYPTDITSESLDLFDMNYVVEGMVNLESLEEPFVSSNTKSISLNGLLKFEPFAKLPASILSEIYNQDNPRYSCVLSDQFLTRLAEQIGKNSLFLEVISCILRECDILPSSHPSVTKDNLYIKLMKWRDIRHITYQCLQKSLDQFSVFIGLNILVRLIYMHILLVSITDRHNNICMDNLFYIMNDACYA